MTPITTTRTTRCFAPHELGRNGNPPPFAYQRRIDYLGPQPRRGGQFRTDWLDSITTAQMNGELSAAAAAVAAVVAASSNRNGKDVTFTQAWYGRKLHKRNGATYSAKYAKRGLDELQQRGFLDREHGRSDQRFDEQRRQMLGGRWQGACTYRLHIPPRYQQLIDERRQAFRRRNQNGGRVTPPARPHPPRRNDRQTAIASDARRLAHNVSTFEQGVRQLEQAYKAGEYMLAYEEFQDAWNVRHGP